MTLISPIHFFTISLFLSLFFPSLSPLSHFSNILSHRSITFYVYPKVISFSYISSQ